VMRSKADRGYELLDGKEPDATSGHPDTVAGTSSAEAFQRIGRACLRQVADNEHAVSVGDAEGVHQMRVGLRRLRAAISLFSSLLEDRQTSAIKHELKWLTSELGPARELDVFIRHALHPVHRLHAREGGMLALCEDADRRRAEAFERAAHAVQSQRFQKLVLDVAGWLETGDWIGSSEPLLAGRRARPIEDFAVDRLQRWHRQIKKRGRRLDKLGAHQRHRLRIKAKKLRYAAEFFGDLFSGAKAARRRKAFLKSLKKLQDGLGELNDIVVHRKLAARLAKANNGRREGHAAPKLPFWAGLASGREESRLAPILQSAARAHRQFKHRKPFWT